MRLRRIVMTIRRVTSHLEHRTQVVKVADNVSAKQTIKHVYPKVQV